MSGPAAQVISAQVVVRDHPTVTEDRIRDCEHAFAERGFDVGHRFGGSFSISATLAAFEATFGCALASDERGVHREGGTPQAPDYELPLDALPETCRFAIAAVTFSPPPDFGPGSF